MYYKWCLCVSKPPHIGCYGLLCHLLDYDQGVWTALVARWHTHTPPLSLFQAHVKFCTKVPYSQILFPDL